jgi:hypothetical protein
MNKVIAIFIVCLLVTGGCTKTAGPDHAHAVARVRKWSGYHQLYRYGFPGDPANYNITITDTSFSPMEVSSNLLAMPFAVLPVKYNGSKSTGSSVTFDSSGTYVVKDSLTYFVSPDSVVFYYFSMSMGPHGMEDPWMEYVFLYSHK